MGSDAMPRKASVEMLIPGDIIAIYAGNETSSGSATLERMPTFDEFTPPRHVTLWTTGGRYDVPAGSQLDVLAWAPMP